MLARSGVRPTPPATDGQIRRLHGSLVEAFGEDSVVDCGGHCEVLVGRGGTRWPVGFHEADSYLGGLRGYAGMLRRTADGIEGFENALLGDR